MTLQLYILRQLLVSCGFALAGLSLILLPTVMVQAIYKLGGVSMLAVFEYLPLVLVELVPYIVPMGFLLGVVATYGRLAAERELVAIRMAGIHPARLALPGVLVAVGLSLWTNHLLSSVSPEWKYLQRSFTKEADKEAFKNFAQGRTEIEFGESSLKAERAYDNVFEEVLLDLVEENLTVTADRAELLLKDDVFHIVMTNAHVLSEGVWIESERPYWSKPLDELFPHQVRDKNQPKYMLTEELWERLEEGVETEEDRLAFQYEIHRRRALSVTSLIFLLLGIPTGIVLRSSTQLGAFTGAVGYAFFYFVLAIRLGKELALAGAMPPLIAAWFTNLLFFVFGAVLFYRALWR